MKQEESSKEDIILRNLFSTSEVNSKVDLTEVIMKRIDESNQLFEYSPIISKKVWIWLGVGFVSLITFLLTQTESWKLQSPQVLEKTDLFLEKVRNSFRLDWGFSYQLNLVELQSTYLIALIAFIIIGVYLMISLRMNRGIFR